MEKPFVLLADDNEATCTLIRALLRPEFEVDVVMDGFDAIEKLKSHRYAAILLDLRMPVAGGHSVLDVLAEERPELMRRVLVVSAALSQNERERVSKYGVCGVISKPFEVDSLLAAVKECSGSDDDVPPARGPLISSGMIFLLADLLRQRWM